MKKFALFLAPLLFMSCVFVAHDDYYSLSEKSTYNKFNTLEEPVVFCIPFSKVYSLYGQGVVTSNTPSGSLFLIYDSKTDSLVDYFHYSSSNGVSYFEQECAVGNLKSDGGSVFYTTTSNPENKVICIDSNATEPKLIEYEEAPSSVWSSRGLPLSQTAPIRIINQNSYSPEFTTEMTCQVYSYDSAADPKEPICQFKTASFMDLSTHPAVPDTDGNYWCVATTVKDEETHYTKSRIVFINVKDKKVEYPFDDIINEEGFEYIDEKDDWSDSFFYYAEYADSQSVVLLKQPYFKNDAISLLIYNRSTKAVDEIPLPFESLGAVKGQNFYIASTAYTNGSLYVVLNNVSDYKVVQVNLSTKAITSHTDVHTDQQLLHTFVRGKKIYFYDAEANNLSMCYFDTATNEFSSKKNWNLDSVLDLED